MGRCPADGAEKGMGSAPLMVLGGDAPHVRLEASSCTRPSSLVFGHTTLKQWWFCKTDRETPIRCCRASTAAALHCAVRQRRVEQGLLRVQEQPQSAIGNKQ